ncbi:MAG: hypothetical protein FD177_1921 [Desulfovibrionaceae bacterium]|nr:MAG: hypothetical protein FD177_1921 [Desulfovibrionaceae bacterium]
MRRDHSGTLLQLMTFTIPYEEFGLDILRVQKIIRIMEINRASSAIWRLLRKVGQP